MAKIERISHGFYIIGYKEDVPTGIYGPLESIDDAEAIIDDVIANDNPIKFTIAANVGDYFVYPEK